MIENIFSYDGEIVSILLTSDYIMAIYADGLYEKLDIIEVDIIGGYEDEF